jgi:hypothetical protein
MYQPTCMSCMNPMMGVQQQCWTCSGGMQDIEAMYPQTYHIVYPCIRQECDMMEMQFGSMYTPGHEKMKEIVDKIYARVEADVEITLRDQKDSKENRQLGFGGRRLLRDLISILFLREILRRRPFFGGFGFRYWPEYGFYGGFPSY